MERPCRATTDFEKIAGWHWFVCEPVIFDRRMTPQHHESQPMTAADFRRIALSLEGVEECSHIGVSDHGGWAVLVTVARDGTLLDRRRVELVGEGLPKIPHHSEGQRLPLDEAVELVERVRVSAEKHAVLALDAVTTAVPRILGVALRKCPPLPPTIAERIKDYRAQNIADWVMYRKALASAAEARGWPVHWYDAKSVLECGAPGAACRGPRRSLPQGAEGPRAALEQ